MCLLKILLLSVWLPRIVVATIWRQRATRKHRQAVTSSAVTMETKLAGLYLRPSIGFFGFLCVCHEVRRVCRSMKVLGHPGHGNLLRFKITAGPDFFWHRDLLDEVKHSFIHLFWEIREAEKSFQTNQLKKKLFWESNTQKCHNTTQTFGILQILFIFFFLLIDLFAPTDWIPLVVGGRPLSVVLKPGRLTRSNHWHPFRRDGGRRGEGG